MNEYQITFASFVPAIYEIELGKNIFPEEMENLVNRIEGVKESFIFGKSNKEDKDDIKIHVKVVYDKEIVKEAYKVETEEEIYTAINHKIKEINKTMPLYKAIRGIILTETPLIKTTTSKIKRQEEIATSPMVGTFYIKFSPNSNPYVEIGSIVKKEIFFVL